MLEKASIASGATLALVMGAIVVFSLYVRRHRQQKQRLVEMDQSVHRLDIAMAYHAPTNGANGNGDDNGGTDTVDSSALVAVHSTLHTNLLPMRPFGPHHCRNIPLATAYAGSISETNGGGQPI